MDLDPQCPICANTDLKAWAKKNGFQLYRCRNCTHVFADLRGIEMDYANPEKFRRRITNELMSSDEAYYEHLSQSEQPGGHTWITARMITRQVDRREPVQPGQSWLDVGSGSGYLLVLAQGLGFNVVGLEPGGWGQIAARHKQVKVVQGFLTPTTFQQAFDVISATDVLEHQSDPAKFLTGLQFYLKPRGLLYLSFPFGGCFRAKLLKDRWNMVEPPTHCQFFTVKSFNLLASRQKLAVVAKKTFNTSGFPGVSRLGISNATANKFINAIGWGDQMLVALEKMNQNQTHSHCAPS